MQTLKLAALFAGMQLAALTAAFLVAIAVADCHGNHLVLDRSYEARGVWVTIRRADTKAVLWHGELPVTVHETPLAHPGEGRLAVEIRFPDGTHREVAVAYATSMLGREYFILVDRDKDIRFSRELTPGGTVMKLLTCVERAAFERWLAP